MLEQASFRLHGRRVSAWSVFVENVILLPMGIVHLSHAVATVVTLMVFLFRLSVAGIKTGTLDVRQSLVLTTLFACLCLSAPARGDTGGGSTVADDATVEVRVAPVVIDGETLFSVRGVTALPAERRASGITKRIVAAAQNRSITEASLTLAEDRGHTWILAGGERIMAVLDEDAALEQLNAHRVADLYRARIAEAISQYRRDRLPAVLWVNAVYSLVATCVLFAVWFIGHRLVLLIRAALERRYRARVQKIQDRAFQLVKADQIWNALMWVLNLTWTLAIVAMAYFYLSHVLARFPWTRGVANSLFSMAMDPLATMGLGFVALLPKLAFLAVLVLATRYVLRLTRLLFDGLAHGTVTLGGFDPEWASPTYRLVRLLVIAFAVVVAYPYIPGSSSDAFKGVSLFAGVIFSLGSSSLIGNVIAGYTMTYRRAFKIGDRVKIGQHVGDVQESRLLVTHLRTPKNEEVVVPNSTILGSEVINYTSLAHRNGLILHTTVGIGYETPWRQVEAILLEAARRTPGLRTQPPPFVLQKELGDFCVTYEINVFCDSPGLMEKLYTELHRNMLDGFNEYNVQIMTPAYEGDPSEPKVVRREHWYDAPAQAPSAATSRV